MSNEEYLKLLRGAIELAKSFIKPTSANYPYWKKQIEEMEAKILILTTKTE